jgi:hypothetical protein
MSSLTLGPNGGLMFCMEFLEKNMDWLMKQLSNYRDHYFLFDCPGQVCPECFSHMLDSRLVYFSISVLYIDGETIYSIVIVVV